MPTLNRPARRLPLLLGLAVAALLSACSGKSDCSKACKHLAGCYPSGTAPACSLSAECDAQERCQADCILDADCPAITGSNAGGRAALDACLKQCGTSVTDGGWRDGPLSFDLVTADHLHLDTHLFADLRPHDTAPEPDTQAAGAVGKFCHALVSGTQNIWMELRLGSGSTQLTLSAYTGDCNTSVGSPCISLPVGSAVPYDLRYNSQSFETGTVAITAGKEYVFLAEASAEAGTVSLWAGALNPGYTCQTIDPYAP